MAEQQRSLEDDVVEDLNPVEDINRDRELNKKLSSQNPDRVEDYNRRADRRREEYSRSNYDESQSDTGE